MSRYNRYTYLNPTISILDIYDLQGLNLSIFNVIYSILIMPTHTYLIVYVKKCNKLITN